MSTLTPALLDFLSKPNRGMFVTLRNNGTPQGA